MDLLTGEPIDIQRLVAVVAGADRGGTVLFLGSVRRGPEDGPVTAIDYSAYQEMVSAEFARIIGEAEARWPGVRVTAQHRIGHVPVGEPSIAAVAAAPHRVAAFDACRYVVEEAKRRLPVWKKELYDDGSRRWREDEASGPRASDVLPLG